ncbi:MAG: hypothetical protein HY261_07110, partial [Chloroflexi bacterium]|nr:hypothetical protein [Chloroflexota bacterium]
MKHERKALTGLRSKSRPRALKRPWAIAGLVTMLVGLMLGLMPLSGNAQASALEQWAATASASSEYGGGWAASRATGEPDVYPLCGDRTGAWAPRSSGADPEALEV